MTREPRPGPITRAREAGLRLKEDPKGYLQPMVVSRVARIWLSRGGGLYGLGYLITFIAIEVQTIISVVFSPQSVGDLVTNQLIDLLTRSLLNTIYALIWPAYLLELGFWGIILLIGGFIAYNRFLNPLIEARFPELAIGNQTRRSTKANKATAKTNKKRRADVRPTDVGSE